MKGSRKVYRGYDVKNDDNKDGNNVEMVGGMWGRLFGNSAQQPQQQQQQQVESPPPSTTKEEGAMDILTDDSGGEEDDAEFVDTFEIPEEEYKQKIQKLRNHIENMRAGIKIKLKDINSNNLCKLVEDLLKEIKFEDTLVEE